MNSEFGNLFPGNHQNINHQQTAARRPTKNEPSGAGKVQIEELAELISASISDMSTFSVTPDKRAILQETVQKIKRLKEQDSAIRSGSDPVQQGDVSSSRPSTLNNDVLGPLLLEALDGFLFVVDHQGTIAFISENVAEFLNYSQNDLVGKSIYKFVHAGDHAKFSSTVRPMSVGTDVNWPSDIGSQQAVKNKVFECRMLVKASGAGENSEFGFGPHYENIQVSAVLQPYPVEKDTVSKEGKQLCLVCIAHRVTVNEPPSSGSMLGIEQFTTKQDLNGKIVAYDTSTISLSKYRHADFTGQNIKDFCHVNDCQQLLKHLQEVLKSGCDTSGVYRFKLQENRYVFVQTKSKRIDNPGTNEHAFIWSTHSIIRECDSDVELKGSASTSLMKSIIQSNNAGNGAGNMAQAQFQGMGYGQPRRRPSSLSSVSSVPSMDMNTDFNLNDVLSMPNDNWGSYSGDMNQMGMVGTPSPMAQPQWNNLPSVNISYGAGQPPNYLPRQNSVGGYSNSPRSPGYSGGQRSPGFAGGVGRNPSFSSGQFNTGRGSPYNMVNRRMSSTSSITSMPRTPTGGFSNSVNQTPTNPTTPMEALRSMAGLPSDQQRKMSVQQTNKDNASHQNQLRRLLSMDLDGENEVSDSKDRPHQSPQPGPGQDQPQVHPDSNTKESMSPSSSRGPKTSSSVLKALLSEDEDSGDGKTETSKGNEAEPKKPDNMLLKRLLNEQTDAKDPAGRKDRSSIIQRLLSEEEENQSAEVTSQHPGETSEQHHRQLVKQESVDSTQNLPMFTETNSSDSFFNDLLSPVATSGRELDSFLANLWEKEIQKDENRGGVKRKLSAADMVDSTENDMEPSTSSNGSTQKSILLKELLTKRKQGVHPGAAVSSNTNPSVTPRIPSVSNSNIIDIQLPKNGKENLPPDKSMQQASRTVNPRDNPSTNPNTPFPGNTNGKPGQMHPGGDGQNMMGAQGGGGELQQLVDQPMDIALGAIGDNNNLSTQQDFSIRSGNGTEDVQLFAQLEQALGSSDMSDIDRLLGIDQSSHPSDPSEQMAIDAIQRQLMGEADHASKQFLPPDSTGISGTTTASSDNMSMGRMRQMSQNVIPPQNMEMRFNQPRPMYSQQMSGQRIPQAMMSSGGQIRPAAFQGAANVNQQVRQNLIMQHQQRRAQQIQQQQKRQLMQLAERKRLQMLQQPQQFQQQASGGYMQQQTSMDMDTGPLQGSGTFAESFADLMNSGVVPNVSLGRAQQNAFNQAPAIGNVPNTSQGPFGQQGQLWGQSRPNQSMMQTGPTPGQTSQFGGIPRQRPMMNTQGNAQFQGSDPNFGGQQSAQLNMFTKQQQQQQIRQQLLQRQMGMQGRGSPRGPQSPYGGGAPHDSMLMSPNQQTGPRLSPGSQIAPSYNTVTPMSSSGVPMSTMTQNYPITSSSPNFSTSIVGSFDQDVSMFGIGCQESMSVPMSTSPSMTGSTSQYVKNELRELVSSRTQQPASALGPLAILDSEIPDDLLDQIAELTKEQELQQYQQHQQQQPLSASMSQQHQPQPVQNMQTSMSMRTSMSSSVSSSMPSSRPQEVITRSREEARLRFQQLHSLAHTDEDPEQAAGTLFRSQLTVTQDGRQPTNKKPTGRVPPKIEIPASVNIVQVEPRTPIDDIKPADQKNSLLQQLLSE